MARILWFSLLAVLLSTSIGCRLCDRGPAPACASAPAPGFVAPPPPAPLAYAPQPIQQSGAIQGLPPGAVYNPPPGANIIQPGQPAPPPLVQPPSISKSPQEQTQWQPAEGYSAPPRIEQERKQAPSIRLYAPEAVEKEPAAQQQSPLTTLPPIPQFAVAKEDRIFTGLRPKLDGLDWLQSNGVKVVINIQTPGKDDSADRTQVEKRKMRYVAFEVSPQTLSKEKADEFVKLIRQTSEQSIFVYDEDGALAGSMWYLFARQGLLLDDDTAQVRAGQLGLEVNRDGPHRVMWLAVQKLLSER